MGCTASQPTGRDMAGINGHPKKATSTASNGRGGLLKRQDSALSSSTRTRRGGGGLSPPNQTMNGNGHAHAHAFTNGSPTEVSPQADPRWITLWETYRSMLLDPADTHSAMDAFMAEATNRLSPMEVTFLQRKVRAIVRTSNLAQEKGNRISILRNGSHLNEAQETRAVADKFHLLTKSVVRKTLPKLPTLSTTNGHHPDATGAMESIDENVYLLCLYLHESLWDRVAEISTSSAMTAGLDMDVNNYRLPDQAPAPLPPVSSDVPQVPPGISLYSFTFIIALALRGSRKQRLQLLFYLLLPPKVLQAFLEQHPAGGPPLFLLEVGFDNVFSLASLSHYYWYGDTFVPGKEKVLSQQQTHSTENGNGTSKTSTRGHLELEGTRLVSLIKAILIPPPSIAEGARTPIMQVVEPPTNGSKTPNGASPLKKTVKMRRRISNQALEEEIALFTSQTEVMERLNNPLFFLEDYVGDDVSTAEALTKAATAVVSQQHVSMDEFMAFCEQTIHDQALDAIMNRFFAHSILPSPSIELDLVRSRWREWQETERLLYTKAMEQPEGTLEMLTQSVRKILMMQKGEPTDESSSEMKRDGKPFGGMGGFDGRGGIGFGVMYCVPKKWWTAWEDYVGWTWAGESSNGSLHKPAHLRRRPGDLSSEPLLDRLDDEIVAGTYGSYELMLTGLVKDRDYVLIPPGVWDVLYEIYGGGPPLPRMVLPPVTPAQTNGNSNAIGIDACGGSVEAELKAVPSEMQLDAMASKDNVDRVLRLPAQMEVDTHPWVLHVHLCDPSQPYRRGDAGPMSIRVMANPEQPFWRLYAEIVSRLPFRLYRAFGPDGRGKARLWKRIDSSGAKDATLRFGPWSLLCKNRVALIPKMGGDDEFEDHLRDLRDDWQEFADNSSVESIGLANGDQIMVECAVLNRNNEFIWPREMAAKAGRVKRLADEDMKFRQLLRGVDENGTTVGTSRDLVGMKVDAMDTSGKWFQVVISKVQVVPIDTDDEEDSLEMENGVEPRKDGGDSKQQVLVDFTEHGGHLEWIDVESDRLASPGRFTLGSADEAPEPVQKPVASTDGKPKVQGQVKKAIEPAEVTTKVCTIPGYGACGLANLGNTCYVNSAIQCVSYMPLLRSYLLSARYRAAGDLNRDNPIGTGGKLLEEFAELLRLMWSAKYGEKAPTKFRGALGRTNEQFAGADQQDSQEFLSFILDVLHEDSNRVRKKPAVGGLEDDWVKTTTLPRVGEEAWRRFLRRNRSVMADVGMGQVLNIVTCPVCNFSSRNFDPFNLLSVPFPTVADVIFRCYVVRRATAFNTPWILNKPKKGGKYRTRFVRRDLVPHPKPPSEQLVVEEYIIAMSRLADSGDLKLQIQNLAGIPAADMRLCRAEEVLLKDRGDDSVVRKHTQVTLLTDKEGPCSQIGNRQRANSEDVSTAPSAPTLIVAFESTIRSRPPIDKRSEEEASDSTGDDDEDEQAEKVGEPNKKESKQLEELVSVYGNPEECRIYDTETLPIAKALSRSLWPEHEDELKLGLRVDAIDHREHWFPGSVVEILKNDTNAESKEEEGATTKVRIHFDNFSSKWDEMYTIEHFKEGRVRPLYSHAAPRTKPTEFPVHHRFTDRTTRLSNLFGQSFYVQCHNEWSTARAGAQILAQAARYVRQPPDIGFSPGDTDSQNQERIAKIQRLYDRTQAVISDLIDLLIDCDREYIQYGLGITPDPNADPNKTVERFRNPGFDASHLSQSLVKRVNALLHKLPFEVRVCTIDSPLGATNDEVAFPFSLMRTIGNYMNARHAVVLQWREPPSDKKATGGRSTNYLGAPVMYVQPHVAVDAKSAEILDEANHAAKRSSSSRASAGLHLGVCFTEFCKQQQLSTWRCPKCQDFRDGKQNMALWRLPDLLTIHIKRFNCSARWREKITTKVNFPLTGLDLLEWCHSESPVVQEDANGETAVYDLIGVLNHYGGMTGGHYVAFCKATACSKDGSEEAAHDFNGAGTSKPIFPGEPDAEAMPGWKFGRQKPEVNQSKVTATSTAKAAADSSEPLWLQFDDDLVEPIPPRYVVSEMAYVLFYRRRRLTPANVAKYSTLE